jgi:hypothetical protein
MGYTSIAFSLLAICMVILMFAITNIAYKRKTKQDVDWFNIYKEIWSSPEKLNEVFEPNEEDMYGDIGTFEGYEVPEDQQEWSYISDTLVKQDLISFISKGGPDRIGTKTVKSRENEILDSKLT